MILCLGSIADETFGAGLAALRSSGVAYTVIDVAQLVLDGGAISLDNAQWEKSSIQLHDRVEYLGRYSGIWARIIDIALAAPDDKARCRCLSIQAALEFICQSASAQLPVMNAPPLDASNFSKPLHLLVGSAYPGFQIPRSCLTNDPVSAREFVESCPNGAIYKGVSATKTWVSCYDRKADHGRLDLIGDCPVLFQERIAGPDVRVHVVDGALFAESILSTAVDYRRGRGNLYSRTEVPTTIAESCLQIAQNVGLPLTGIDFKIDALTGAWYFLEINSLPCFQPYDRRAGGEISAAIVRYLTGAIAPRRVGQSCNPDRRRTNRT